ncbi:MAG: hypothetical protein DRJ01_10915 [Bacteroidetes bacterium]|nr:MAG: hypothetical protein DRJ01_10915 [Bacteroidota bacterium]
MKKKKIAVVVASFPAISETFIINHIVELIKQGHNVTIFSDAFNKTGMVHKIVEDYNLIEKTVYRKNPGRGIIRFFKIFIAFFTHLKYFKVLIKSFSKKYYGNYAVKGYFFFEVLPFLKKEYQEFDIIHAHFGNVGNKVSMIKNLGLLKGKFVTTFYGHDINDYRQIKSQDNYKMLEKYCDYILFVTSDLLEKYETITNSIIPLTVLPSNINQKVFVPKKYNAEKKKIIFITVGRLIDWKGQNLVIEAMNFLYKKNPNVNIKYHIVGAGAQNEDEEWQKKVLYYKLENKIFFFGALSHSEVANKLNEADVFILFGVVDKYGNIDAQANVVQEAQSVGLPVIVSDAGGLPEDMQNNKTGYVVKEKSIEELVNRMLFFYNNPNKIEEMGRKAVDFVKNKYSTKVVFKKLFEIYESL